METLISFVIAAAIVALPAWRICARAGLSPYLSLVVFVPMGFLILLVLLAFAEWPAFRKDVRQ